MSRIVAALVLVLALSIIDESRAEQLEAHWQNPENGNWNEAVRWTTNQVPNNGFPNVDDTYAAIVETVGDYQIELTDDITLDRIFINSLRTKLLHLDGLLSVPEIHVNSGTYSMVSGLPNRGNPGLRDVTLTGRGVFMISGSPYGKSEIDNVTIDANVIIDSEIEITDRGRGLGPIITNGLRISDGKALSFGVTHGDKLITFDGTQTLSGPGEVVILGPDFSAGIVSADVPDGSVLTVAFDMSITARNHGFSLGLGTGDLINRGRFVAESEQRFRVATANFNNEGTIQAVDGGLIMLEGDWKNLGRLSVTRGSSVELGGQFSPSDIGVIERDTTSSIRLGGILDLRGASYSANGATGDISLWALRQRTDPFSVGGGIANGRIESTDGSRWIVAAKSLFDGVEVGGDVVIAGPVVVRNGLKLDGVTVQVDSQFHQISEGGPGFEFDGNQTLSGTGRIEFISAGRIAVNDRLTVAESIAISVGDSDLIISGNELVNNGSIFAGDRNVNRIDFELAKFTNNGVVETSGEVNFGPNWQNNGVVTVLPGSALTIGGGEFTGSKVGDIRVHPDGRLVFDGARINQTEGSLDWHQLADSEMIGTRVVGGTISTETTLTLRGEIELEDVVLQGAINVLRPDFSGRTSLVRVIGDLTLDRASFAIQDLTGVEFLPVGGAPPRIVGEGDFVWRATSNTNGQSTIGHVDLEIEPGIVFRTENDQSNGELSFLLNKNHGLMSMSTPDTTFALSLRENTGTIEVAHPDTTVQLVHDLWTNAGTLHAKAGRLRLAGGYQTGSLMDVRIDEGILELAGRLDNRNANYAVGPSVEVTGTLHGGELTFDQSAAMMGTIENAVVGGHLLVPDFSSATFSQSTFVSPKLDLGNNSVANITGSQGPIDITVRGSANRKSTIVFADPFVLTTESRIIANDGNLDIEGELTNRGEIHVAGRDASVLISDALQNAGIVSATDGAVLVVNENRPDAAGGVWTVDSLSGIIFQNPWEMSADDTIRVELLGSSSAPILSGTSLTSNGNLEIVLGAGFQARPNIPYPILGFDMRTGSFGNLALAKLPNGFAWDTSKLATSGTILIDGPAPTIVRSTSFREANVGDVDFVVNQDSTEIGFASDIVVRGNNPAAGVVRIGQQSPQSFLVFQSVESNTTFDTIPISEFGSIDFGIALQVSDTRYENTDFVQVYLTNGIEEILAIDLRRRELDEIAGAGVRNYRFTIPSRWTDVTARIATFTDSSRGDERIEIASLEFAGYSLDVLGGEPGDYDLDGVLGVADIDKMTHAIRTGTNLSAFNLNGDDKVDNGDRQFWIRQIKKTWFGDSNLDGEFNTRDFVEVFQHGQYEDDIAGNATWQTGDWNGDGDFSTSDFVVAFQDGGYEKGPRAISNVPEPNSMWAVLLLLQFCLRRRYATVTQSFLDGSFVGVREYDRRR